MKALAQAITRRDGNALSNFATARKPATATPVTDETIRIFNELFRQLVAAFPATSAQFKDQATFNELRRQWVLAFAENGIHSTTQVERGMREARKNPSPFLPAPGQFVAWCLASDVIDERLPDVDALYRMVMTYSATRFDHENYPWPNAACYWMVTQLFDQMRSGNLTEAELRRCCTKELIRMSQRLAEGEPVPEPVMMITSTYTPVSHKRGLERIAGLRALLKNRRTH